MGSHLANRRHDVRSRVTAEEHVALAKVAGVLGHVAKDVVLGRGAARGKGDGGHDMVGQDLAEKGEVLRRGSMQVQKGRVRQVSKAGSGAGAQGCEWEWKSVHQGRHPRCSNDRTSFVSTTTSAMPVVDTDSRTLRFITVGSSVQASKKSK